ncbi:MAG: PAS domain S-box protein [Candidatus Cloacimonetes bacterium]|nr:PAS domain S-box protein [Candidatus Cloacimonadota bacterium]MCF7813809.1 PAS domain S-box protein [Candidatus Cloacimonadota bacterium]MCF7868488.1 PAS domain S-box protein [Candidatus Cloacimonadota bacterium]
MKKRILVVENEIIIAEDIKKTLIKNNYDVIDVIGTGKQAISEIPKQKPDIILMDIMLDDKISGIQVAEDIKSTNIPVVFLTAYADAEKIEKVKLTETFGYLIKPFRERELIATMEMALYKNKIEMQLRKSLMDYERIFENIQDVYFETDTKGRILQISPSILENSSYSIEDIIGANIKDFVYNIDYIDAFISKLTKERYVKDYTLTFKDLDGSKITTLCSAKFIIDKNLDKCKVVGSLKNITENIQTKESIADNMNKYKSLFETTMDAVILYGKEGIVDCNQQALELLRLDKKDFLLNTHPEDYSPKYQPNGTSSKKLAEEYTKEVFEKGNKEFEWTFKKADRTTFKAKVWFSVININGKRIIQSTVKDLSQIESMKRKLEFQQNEIENKIQDSTSKLKNEIKTLKKINLDKSKEIEKIKTNEAFYNALFQNNPVETIVVNKKGEIVRFNLAVKNNRSRPPKIGDRMYIDYAARHKTDMFGNLVDCIRNGKQKTFSDLAYKDKIWDITIAPYEHGAIISSRNVTAQKQAEERLMKLNDIFAKLGRDAQSNIDVIIKEVSQILSSTCSLLVLKNPIKNDYSIFSSHNLPPDFKSDEELLRFKNFQEKENILIIEDIENSEFSDIIKFSGRYGLNSLMCFPVYNQQKYFGSICILDTKIRNYSDMEQHVFSTMAKLVSNEIERMRFSNSLKKISMTQKLMLNTARQINSSLDFKEVTRKITMEAMDLLNAYGCAVYLLDDDNKTLKPIVVIDPEFEEEIANTPIEIDNSYTGKAIINKKVMIFNDTAQKDNGFQIPGTTELDNERILAAPLISEEKIYGAICLNKMGANFTTENAEIMEILANHATTALKNAETFEKLQHEMQERLQAELQRDESLKELNSLQSNVPVGIFRSTPEGKLISINHPFVKMFGYKNEEEIININTKEFYADLNDRKKVIDQLRSEGVVDDLELQLKSKDGAKFWALLSIKAVYDEDDNWVFQDGIINDITKRKSAEEILLRTQMRLTTVLESVPNIVLFETAGKQEFISDNVEHLLGYKAKEFQQDPDFFFKLVHEDDIEFVEKKYAEWKDNKRKGLLTLWCRIRKADGEYLWIEDRRVETEDGFGNKFESGVRIDTTNLKNAEEELKLSYEKLQKLLAETVNGLVSAVEMRDPYTAGHQRRVAQLSTAIAEKMKLSKHDIEGLNLASLVHDIGKINVPAEILSKPGRLTDTEFNLIKTHPQTGYDILKSIDFPWPVAEIVLQHQERYDGSSYPQGLKGNEINIMARIICVADVVEAMSSHRPYRPSLGTEMAIGEIKKNRGKLYDPKVVDACLELFEKDNFTFSDEV